jgi:hypothetical protein
MKFISKIWKSVTSATTATLLCGSMHGNDNYNVPIQNKITNPDLRPHWELYPKSYVVKKIHTKSRKVSQNEKESLSPAFDIDGNIDKDIWENVPWSTPFDDIQGEDEPEPKREIPITQFKALYDDSYLYILAILHPADGLSTKAYFTERNSPIYQRDSDFEVFIDVDNSNHMYKELEVNAINTIWNLLLDKPYDDGGQEHSGRIASIGETMYYDVNYEYTATKIISGIINDEKNNTGALWSVEIALSFTDLLSNTTYKNSNYTPTGNLWRVNFSRVEKEGKINWTWQPQNRWNPALRQFDGFVQMHLPDAWGYFCFVDDDELASDAARSTSLSSIDPIWPEKLAAMTVYYALHYYKSQNGQFTSDISELILPINIITPFLIHIQLQSRNESGGGFLICVTNPDNYGPIILVSDDRLLRVKHKQSMDELEA